MTRVREDHLTRNVVDEGLRYICIKASSNSINPRQDVPGLGWDETDFCETFLSVWVKSTGNPIKVTRIFAKSNIKEKKSKLEIVCMKWCDKNYLSSVLQLRLKYEGEKKQKKKKMKRKISNIINCLNNWSEWKKLFFKSARFQQFQRTSRSGTRLSTCLSVTQSSLRLGLNVISNVINLISIARVRVM